MHNLKKNKKKGNNRFNGDKAILHIKEPIISKGFSFLFCIYIYTKISRALPILSSRSEISGVICSSETGLEWTGSHSKTPAPVSWLS